MGRNLRLLVAVVAAGASSRLALHEWAEGYEVRRSWVVALVAVLAIVAVLEPIGVIARRSLEPISEANRPTLDILGRAALVQVIDHCAGDYKRIAVNVYVVRKTWSRPFQGEQLRVFRLRLAASPASSNIRWTKGKGLIGRVWEQECEQAVNLRLLYGHLPDQCSAELWAQQPDDVRLGMSHAEYRQVSGYGVIVAVPIIKKGKYRGCVSMDAPEDYDGRAYDIEVTSPLQFVANAVATWL